MRRSGIDIIGNVPWGAHFCQFYQTSHDLLDVLVRYFRQGLLDNEYCMWVTSDPLGVDAARSALRSAVPDLDQRIERGQIEFLDYRQWYTLDGRFDANRVLCGWIERERWALDRGFEGLRLTGNTFWLEKGDWQRFTDCEAAVDGAIGSHRMIALCTYALEKCAAAEILDVLRNHQFALIKQQGKWELIQSRRAEARIRQQNAVLEGINQIFSQALTCQTEEELGRACLTVAEQVTGSQFGFLAEVDREDKLMDIAVSDPGWAACRMQNPAAHRKAPAAFTIHGIYGRVLRDGKGFFTNDPASHPDSIGLPDGHPPLSAFLGVPLLHDGRSIGIVCVANREGGYRNEDLDAIQSLAVAVMQVFKHFRGERSLHRLNRTLTALGRSSQAMMRARHESDYLDEVCRIIVQDCGHAMVWIGYAEQDEARSVRPVAYSGFEEGYLDTLKLTWADSERGRGPTGTAIRTGRVSMCRNMLTDPRFGPWRAEALKRGYASSIVLPLLADGKAFGALTIYCREPDPFSDDEVRLLADLAGDLAHGITAIRLREAAQRAQAQVRAAKAALEVANAAKDQFIATLSHELRTPLTPVLIAAGSLLRDTHLPDDVRDDLAMIHRNVSLEVTLIDDLLDITRIAAGKVVLDKRPLDVAQVLRDAARICSPDLDGRSQTLCIETPGEPYPVEGDAARLHQVFWNLVKNAIKFTPQGGRITVSGSRDNRTVTVAVRDNGVGIEPAVLPRLFHRFEQGEAGVTRVFGGLGLGLAICRAIVELHGGGIEARSDGRGKGATFLVHLPIAHCCLPAVDFPSRIRAGAAPSLERRQLAMVNRQLHILLVEDHADTARMMARLLKSEGHNIIRADSVQSALAAAQSQTIDVMVSDLGLPDGTGHDLMRQLVACGRQLRAIALSGYGTSADVDKSLAAGFLEHLTKPVDFDALLQSLARIVANAPTQRAP